MLMASLSRCTTHKTHGYTDLAVYGVCVHQRICIMPAAPCTRLLTTCAETFCLSITGPGCFVHAFTVHWATALLSAIPCAFAYVLVFFLE